MKIRLRYGCAQHSRKTAPRKQVRGGLVLLALGVLALASGGAVQAGEVRPASNPPAAQTVILNPAGDVVTSTLRAIHARDAAATFAQMSETQQQNFDKDAARYLKSLRLKQHALYNHSTFRVLSTEQTDTVAIHKVELTARDGAKSLAIFRLQQQQDGSWRIDHIGVVGSSDERDA